MTTLISKAQYKRSEKGEFHEIAARNVEDTIAFLLNFPWETERHLTSVELTCPSITVEYLTGACLKIGPYFSGKFALYYLNTSNNVSFKIVNTLADAAIWITTFFEQEGLLEDWERYTFTLKSETFFHTNPFEYIVNAKAIRNFLGIVIRSGLIIVLLCLILSINRPEISTILAFFTMIPIMLVLTSPLYIVFYNYLLADKDSYLQISQGEDEFVYGKAGNNKIYNKQNIAEVVIYSAWRSRLGLWNDCQVYKITFNDGEQLKFSSLLISESALAMKFSYDRLKFVSRFLPRFV